MSIIRCTMFELCEEQFVRSPPHATLRAWVSGAPLGILFSGHGHRLECGRCLNCNGFEYMSYTGGFDPVAGFPPVGLLLAIRS